MPPSEFTQSFISYVRTGSTVLDLGAGSGKFSEQFLDKGARVTAVDMRKPEHVREGITIIQGTVEDYVAKANREHFDLIFFRNILQFLEKEWVFSVLFPWLHDHINKDGIIGIETFYQNPEPAFNQPLKSLYRIQEFNNVLPKWQKLYSEECDFNGPDLMGRVRHFFIVDLIMRRKR